MGLTLVELMLALTITAMVAAAVAAMLGAVTSGVESRRDSRSHLVQAHAAQVRLAAYIEPSLCVLFADETDLVLWFNDRNRSQTVHATELRWLAYDPDDGVIRVSMVQFPPNWSDADGRIEDDEYEMDDDFWDVRDVYEQKGLLSTLVLVDQLADVAVTLDHFDPMQSRHVTYRLTSTDASVQTLISGSLRMHRTPSQ